MALGPIFQVENVVISSKNAVIPVDEQCFPNR